KETVYIYDGQGRLIEETVISDYILMGYVDKLKTSTSYDESGNITQIAYKTELDSAWFPTEEISMSYDKDNRLIDSSVVLGWIDNYWNYQYTGEKTYDESGKLVLFREYSNWYGDGKLYPSDSTVYLYDNSGRLEETIKYNLRNKNSYTTRRISYNETGLVKSIETLNSSSGYMEGRKYNYEYIEDRWKTMTYEFYVDSIWKPGIKVEYGYDNAGNCTKAEVYYYIDSAWVFPYEEFDIEIPGLSRVVKAYMVEIEYTQINPIAVEHDIHAPATFSLAQNYPNPFNPETKISFSLPQSGKTMLKVYDMLGREVAELINGEMEKGPHSVSFNGRNLSSGVYIYRLQSGSFTESKKMMLLK
ncbi:MAG TPA: T9SS type A sorting domain-containing protein, partial [Ignavibacteriales bacterium]|nr:T9SS type A sorting domain-containing protein [Ignavibacteriales bacterium]